MEVFKILISVGRDVSPEFLLSVLACVINYVMRVEDVFYPRV